MKNAISVFLILITFLNSHTQRITLQPGPAEGLDAIMFELEPNTNFGTHPDIISFYWTFFDIPGGGKSLFKFDLSGIPTNVDIRSAYLSLYHNSTSTNQGQEGRNASYLKKVTANWDENSVTWNNIPSTSFNGAVLLPESNSGTEDYPNINITDFVKEWYANPSSNFGMMLELQNYSLLSSMKFSSSDHLNPLKRPKLVIEYETSIDTCITLQPNGLEGKDAFVFSIEPTTNYGDYIDFISFSWTFFQVPGFGNSLISFDLSQIPKNVEIVDADLTFYHSSSTNQGQAGNNASYLRKIISNWDENSVTWNTVPGTTATGEVYLNTSFSTNQDYPNIKITEIVKGWYANPSSNFGMMLTLEDKSLFNSMKFFSSDATDPNKRPKLVICYKPITANNDLHNTLSGIKLYPILFDDELSIELPHSVQGTKIKIIDEQGKELYKCFTQDERTIFIDCRNFSPGLYLIHFINKNDSKIMKVIKAN